MVTRPRLVCSADRGYLRHRARCLLFRSPIPVAQLSRHRNTASFRDALIAGQEPGFWHKPSAQPPPLDVARFCAAVSLPRQPQLPKRGGNRALADARGWSFAERLPNLHLARPARLQPAARIGCKRCLSQLDPDQWQNRRYAAMNCGVCCVSGRVLAGLSMPFHQDLSGGATMQ